MKGTLGALGRWRPCPNAISGPSRLRLRHARPLLPLSINRARAPGGTIIHLRFSGTSAPKAPTPTAPANLPPHEDASFRALSAALGASQPVFGARGDEITLLSNPTDFKKSLVDMFKRARRRIIISSLYIGASQSDLIEAIAITLRSRPAVKATVILDYHRATRLAPKDGQPPSTAHLLLPLLEEFGDRVEVWLFRSPKLKGVMEKIVPERFDEGWGTWHGKWYCVDDEVVLSGANLATSYFTNRQDRYIHFHNHPSLLSYLSSLTRLFTQYSYKITLNPPLGVPKHHLVPLPSPPNDPVGKASLLWRSYSIHPRSFHQHALAALSAFQNSWKSSNSSRLRRVDVDTWFWPVLQAGVLGIKEEEAAMSRVWQAVKESHEGNRPTSVDLTSGYFGLYKTYKRAVIDSPADVRVICASPKANGFYGSKGFSKLIPEGYTLLESRFYRDALRRGRVYNPATGRGVHLKEWEREGWTYHSKGLWISPSGPSPAGTTLAAPHPFFTFIGSSNLSTRSLKLDTELSLMMLTSSPTLRKALGNEVKGLDEHAVEVSEATFQREERRVSWLAWVLVALGVEGML